VNLPKCTRSNTGESIENKAFEADLQPVFIGKKRVLNDFI
jgi:hypothetical protein